ncbi:SRPBCC family protein [Carboxylicivirga sp. M1479]|uniref:SRPBCC family protein n=1 Tax=Carboxylicivirga sp. M1479 TaxID=2594476 RepID=UPI001178769E|nr:SRPBCC family protein [Carboxylicivirga sp. M1479]TRX66199.1 SRPBCC family protein [Carboxylicivirga sp. M1479]
MGFFQIKRRQFIRASIEEVWDFMSSPHNLKRITPEHMRFDVLSKGLPQRIHEGMIICYRVRPLPFFNVKWLTEITHVREGSFFVDEQRVGPYRLWHHQHHLKEVDGGVEMLDVVTYEPPLKLLGSFANALFIRSKLNEIFDFREFALNFIFKDD